MSHSLTCPFSCLPACLPSPCPGILVVLCCRPPPPSPPPPLPPDVLNYFIRYYSPPTTTTDRTHSIRHPGRHSTPFRSAILPAGLKRTGWDTFCSLIISSESPMALTALLSYFIMVLTIFAWPFASIVQTKRKRYGFIFVYYEQCRSPTIFSNRVFHIDNFFIMFSFGETDLIFHGFTPISCY